MSTSLDQPAYSSSPDSYSDSPEAYDKRESPAARTHRQIKDLFKDRQIDIEIHGDVNWAKDSTGKIVADFGSQQTADITNPPVLSGTPDFSLYDAGSGNLGVKNGSVTGPSFAGLPTGMNAGGLPAYTTSVSGAGFAWLKITWTGNTPSDTVTAVEIDTGSSVPTPNTTTLQYIPLGDYNNTGSAITIGSGGFGIGPQTVFCCNGSFIQNPT